MELARKVKFFGGNGSSAVPSTIGSDEVVQRDSATSAGEDEPHDDNHGRTGPVSSQGRSMLRRRRQFDAQGMQTTYYYSSLFAIMTTTVKRARSKLNTKKCYSLDYCYYNARNGLATY